MPTEHEGALIRSMAALLAGDPGAEPPGSAGVYAWRLLRHHVDFLNYIAEVTIQRAVGDNEGAMQTMKRYMQDFSDREPYIATYYDYAMTWHAYRICGLFTDQPMSFFIN